MRKRVFVIGGGPAGIMAAGKACELGNDVMLFEKNNKLGKKVLISGKGRCNITNNTDIEGLIKNTPGNGNFLYSSFYTFSNQDLISMLNGLGLETKVERGERVFPVSDNSKDVVDTLWKFLELKGVKVRLNSPVDSIVTKDGKVTGIITRDGQKLECDSVVVATGGVSYPGTGSTGDGFKMAKSLGHRVIDLKPSLVPLLTKEKWVKDLQGLSLKNVEVTLKNMRGKKIYNDFGEMLFTHFGVSGPIILSASRHILDYGFKDVVLSIDLKPALNEEKLYDRLTRDFEKYSRKQFKNALDDLLPSKMIPVVIDLSSISPDKFVNQINREEKRNLVKLLKNLELNICGARPINEAIVTAGGVSTLEINPSTMESKLVKGLFFAGEVIDVDAYTGGFNLTIAFSTGYLAGANC
ncbi:MAG TPA: NAD(P)/FAD-dependent oxidoreductase [Pseudobacteroides sp.]|nr:NAD(P)/FAD-dependent oxidoreductase [Pseudobacteroides sp.]